MTEYHSKNPFNVFMDDFIYMNFVVRNYNFLFKTLQLYKLPNSFRYNIAMCGENFILRHNFYI